MRTITGISLDKKLLQDIDQKRGLIPRSRFIEKLLMQFLEEKN